MTQIVLIIFFLTAVECPSLDTPAHANKTGYGCSSSTSRYGTSCFFNCMLGFEAVGGSRQRTCQENRQWSGTQLQCQGNKKSSFFPFGFNQHLCYPIVRQTINFVLSFQTTMTNPFQDNIKLGFIPTSFCLFPYVF